MNEYLASFLGLTVANKMDISESNEIILNIMSNRWYKQAYVQGFDWKSISLKKAVNMFERMDIA